MLQFTEGFSPIDLAPHLELAAHLCQASRCELIPGDFTTSKSLSPDYIFPINYKDQLVGGLGLYDLKQKPLSASQLRSLELIAQQLIPLRERQHHLAQLVRSNREQALALEGSSLGIWDWDLRTNKVNFDRRWCEMLGLVFEETPMVLSTWESRVHPDDLASCHLDIQAYLQGKTPFYENIHRVLHQNGKWVYILDRGKFSDWDEEGRPIRFTGTHFDISLQKNLENQLLDAQAIAKIGSWYFNFTTQELTWSLEHYRIFEISHHQSQNNLLKLSRERIHPDDLRHLDFKFQRARDFGEDFVLDHKLVLDGGKRIKYVQVIGKVILDEKDHPVAVSGTCQDRTQITDENSRLQTLMESMSEGLVVQTEEGAIIQYNPAALKILDLSADQLHGRSSLDPRWRALREDGSDFPGAEHPAMVALKEKRPVYKVTMGLRSNNEELRWISINSIPLKTGEGWIALTTFSDITAIIQAQQEKTFILDTIGVGVWKFNPATGKLDWDRYMFELFEVNPNNFSHNVSDWENCLTDESRPSARTQLARAITGERDFNMSFEIKSKTGKKKVIGAQGKVMRNEAGEPMMLFGINWDRTKEVELEKNLEAERAKSLHQSKLATIGQLAAGVGHEINNPLAIIAGQIMIAEQQLKDLGVSEPRIFDRFRKIENSITRISNIVKGLRTFARSDDAQITIFDLHGPIQETYDLLKDMYEREGVKLTFEDHAPTAFITGNRGRIQQVLINLISNAKDATEGKAQREIKISVEVIEENVLIKVQDNGCGIHPDYQERIFEPFFTTKDPNRGTGIGLSLVSTIIKEHRGRIDLESDIDQGSTFIINLPVQLTPKQMLPQESAPINLEKLPIRVLIVDDEEDLRDVLASGLSRFCLAVNAVDSVREAFRFLETFSVEIIISDIKMPHMDGLDFLRELRSRDDLQQPKFLFISGGVELDKDEEMILDRESDGFIAKPFRIEQILEKLKSLFPPSRVI
jgi:PAS domain S-box-containing protein